MNEEAKKIGALPRWFPVPGIRFETPEGGEGGGAGGETPAVEAGADPAAEAAAAAAAGAGDGAISAEELEGMIRSGTASAFEEMLQRAEHQDAQRRAAETTQQTPDLPEWDPFNREAVMSHIAATINPALNKIIEHFSPALESGESYRLDQGEREANAVLDELGDELESKDFDRGDVIRNASMLMNRNGVEPEAALRQAATEQIKKEQAIEARGVEKWKTQAQNMGNQETELPAGGTGAGEEPAPLKPGERRDYRQAAKATLANMGRRPGVGSPTG